MHKLMFLSRDPFFNIYGRKLVRLLLLEGKDQVLLNLPRGERHLNLFIFILRNVDLSVFILCNFSQFVNFIFQLH